MEFAGRSRVWWVCGAAGGRRGVVTPGGVQGFHEGGGGVGEAVGLVVDHGGGRVWCGGVCAGSCGLAGGGLRDDDHTGDAPCVGLLGGQSERDGQGGVIWGLDELADDGTSAKMLVHVAQHADHGATQRGLGGEWPVDDVAAARVIDSVQAIGRVDGRGRRGEAGHGEAS
jgi:hypothetical protein